MDNRDFRVIVNLNFPKGKRAKAEGIIESLKILYSEAENIHEGEANEEISFVEIRRSGHRLGIADTVIGRWEKGKGKVI